MVDLTLHRSGAHGQPTAMARLNYLCGLRGKPATRVLLLIICITEGTMGITGDIMDITMGTMGITMGHPRASLWAILGHHYGPS
jgi:hypothetical protein